MMLFMARPQFLRLVPPDQTDSWFIGKAGKPPDEWLFFVTSNRRARPRRLSPIPPDWYRLDETQLAELWTRAISFGAPNPAGAPRADPAARRQGKRAQSSGDFEAELLWERERRFALEALLQQSEHLTRELQKDLESANAELGALNEEIQALTSLLGRATPHPPG
jgi:hypothetical protein